MLPDALTTHRVLCVCRCAQTKQIHLYELDLNHLESRPYGTLPQSEWFDTLFFAGDHLFVQQYALANVPRVQRCAVYELDTMQNVFEQEEACFEAFGVFSFKWRKNNDHSLVTQNYWNPSPHQQALDLIQTSQKAENKEEQTLILRILQRYLPNEQATGIFEVLALEEYLFVQYVTENQIYLVGLDAQKRFNLNLLEAGNQPSCFWLYADKWLFCPLQATLYLITFSEFEG